MAGIIVNHLVNQNLRDYCVVDMGRAVALLSSRWISLLSPPPR